MARALIQTVNTSNITLDEGAIIPLGTTTRRFGECLNQNGNGIAIGGTGYYTIRANIVITPAATGNLTVVLANNGTVIPGAIAIGSVSTVGNTITLPIDFTIRRGCCCESFDNITVVLSEGSGTVNNIVVNVVKE